MINEAESFGIEVDFLPVGEGERSGDAICIRWGNLFSTRREEQFVMVIDGGYGQNGKDIVKHIKTYYRTDRVNLVVSTHPHSDHIGGLQTVLEELAVSELLIHQPWSLQDLSKWFQDGRVTDKSVNESLKEGLEAAYNLCRFAKEKKIKVLPAFAPNVKRWLLGVTLHILGPTEAYYKQLLPAFRVTPTTGDGGNSGERIKFSDEMVLYERCPLDNQGQTSAENNTSVILALELPDGGILLFTGDAGIPALDEAMKVAKDEELELSHRICVFQLPHHGSIQNLGPSILHKIFGNWQTNAIAYVSVAKAHDREHPAKHVINALHKRGIRTFMTAGWSIYHSSGRCPPRVGWEPLEAEPWNDMVERVTTGDGKI